MYVLLFKTVLAHLSLPHGVLEVYMIYNAFSKTSQCSLNEKMPEGTIEEKGPEFFFPHHRGLQKVWGHSTCALPQCKPE